MRRLLIASSCLLSLFAVPTSAQIAVDNLDPAARFDAGILQSGQGGLDSSLWQGTDAATATALIEDAQLAKSKSARIFLRAAILSGGTPPQSTSSPQLAAFQNARLEAALGLTSLKNYDFIAGRTSLAPGSAASLAQTAERALIGGDTGTACQTANMVTEGRGEPYWAKLRSFCHYLADELPAMELTADLLKKSGHEDPGFYSLLGTLSGTYIKSVDPGTITSPLHMALAMKAFELEKLESSDLPARLLATLANNPGEDPSKRLDILLGAAELLEPNQIQSLLIEMSDAPLDDITNLPGRGKWAGRDWGSAYLALRDARDMGVQANILAAMLGEADAHGILMPAARAFENEIAVLPYGFQAMANAGKGAEIFTRIAVNNRDLGALRGLHAELAPDNPLRSRIALASDALGNGFMLSELGLDIETGLTATGPKKARAVRDVYVAVGMGAHLSETAHAALTDVKSLAGSSPNAADMLALRSAAKRGSKAEVALRIAKILGDQEVTALRADAVANILSALSDAGMTDLAGTLAAQDFMAGL